MTQTAELLSFQEIQKMCPDEWVVLGNPIIKGFVIISGILVAHGRDKREVALRARDLVKRFASTTFQFTGTPVRQKYLL